MMAAPPVPNLKSALCTFPGALGFCTEISYYCINAVTVKPKGESRINPVPPKVRLSSMHYTANTLQGCVFMGKISISTYDVLVSISQLIAS